MRGGDRARRMVLSIDQPEPAHDRIGHEDGARRKHDAGSDARTMT